MRGLDSRIHPEAVIPGREPCDKIDACINFAPGERTRNPEQCMGLDSGSAPKRAHPGMTRVNKDGLPVKPGNDDDGDYAAFCACASMSSAALTFGRAATRSLNAVRFL